MHTLGFKMGLKWEFEYNFCPKKMGLKTRLKLDFRLKHPEVLDWTWH